MSIRPVADGYVLDCDYCSETLENGDCALALPTPDALTREADDAGWATRGSRHACPRHTTAA